MAALGEMQPSTAHKQNTSSGRIALTLLLSRWPGRRPISLLPALGWLSPDADELSQRLEYQILGEGFHLCVCLGPLSILKGGDRLGDVLLHFLQRVERQHPEIVMSHAEPRVLKAPVSILASVKPVPPRRRGHGWQGLDDLYSRPPVRCGFWVQIVPKGKMTGSSMYSPRLRPLGHLFA